MFFFVPLAYDRIQDGQGSGSKARCDSLIKKAEIVATKIKTHERYGITFLSQAGYTKESRGNPTDKVKTPLCDQIRDYVVSQMPWVVFHSNPQAWGTYEEIRYTLQQAKNYGQMDKENCFYTSTNLGHSFRVWLCLYFLRTELKMWKGWKFRVLIAKQSFTTKEYFQETLKFLGYLNGFIFKGGKIKT